MSLGCTRYETGTFLNWDDATKVCFLRLSRVVYPTLILNINHCILSTWHGNWNGAVANKLHSAKPGDWQSSNSGVGRIKLSCALISHTLTHSYIQQRDRPPQCEHCQSILTVRHSLVGCNHLTQTRKHLVQELWWNYLDSI